MFALLFRCLFFVLTVMMPLKSLKIILKVIIASIPESNNSNVESDLLIAIFQMT